MGTGLWMDKDISGGGERFSRSTLLGDLIYSECKESEMFSLKKLSGRTLLVITSMSPILTASYFKIWKSMLISLLKKNYYQLEEDLTLRGKFQPSP